MVFKPKKNDAKTGSWASGKYKLFPGEHWYLKSDEWKHILKETLHECLILFERGRVDTIRFSKKATQSEHRKLKYSANEKKKTQTSEPGTSITHAYAHCILSLPISTKSLLVEKRLHLGSVHLLPWRVTRGRVRLYVIHRLSGLSWLVVWFDAFDDNLRFRSTHMKKGTTKKLVTSYFLKWNMHSPSCATSRFPVLVSWPPCALSCLKTENNRRERRAWEL